MCNFCDFYRFIYFCYVEFRDRYSPSFSVCFHPFSFILHLFPSILLHSPSVSVHSLLFSYAIPSPPVALSHSVIPSHSAIPSHSVTSRHFCHIPSSVHSSIYIRLFCLILSVTTSNNQQDYRQSFVRISMSF